MAQMTKSVRMRGMNLLHFVLMVAVMTIACLLLFLQMAPLLIRLKQLTIDAHVILHNFCSKSSMSLKKRSM